VLLKTGHVVAAGPLEQIITRSDLPLAIRDDSGAVLRASVLEHDQKCQLTALRVGPVTFCVSLLNREPGTQVRIRVPAREVILAAHEPGPTSIHNVITGSVRAIAEVEGKHAGIVEVAIPGNASLLARITIDAIERLGLVVGRNVTALVKSMSVEILSSEKAVRSMNSDIRYFSSGLSAHGPPRTGGPHQRRGRTGHDDAPSDQDQGGRRHTKTALPKMDLQRAAARVNLRRFPERAAGKRSGSLAA
jgi:molybdopterin-binding protein